MEYVTEEEARMRKRVVAKRKALVEEVEDLTEEDAIAGQETETRRAKDKSCTTMAGLHHCINIYCNCCITFL